MGPFTRDARGRPVKHRDRRGSMFDYLQAKKTAADDASFLSSVGKRDYLYGAAALGGGIGAYCIVGAFCGSFAGLAWISGISAFVAILWVGFQEKVRNWMRH